MPSDPARSERLRFARRTGRHTRQEWEWLLDACDSRCVRCGWDEDICRDHIILLYQGGGDTIVNIQPLCRSCNSSKGPESIDWRPWYVLEALDLEIDRPDDVGPLEWEADLL